MYEHVMNAIGRPASVHGVKTPEEYVGLARAVRANRANRLVERCLVVLTTNADKVARAVESLEHAGAADRQAAAGRLAALDNAASALRALLASGALGAGVTDAVRESDQRPTAYVSDGRWVCDCACGNSPSVDPDWRLAACFTCGALIHPLVPPDVAEAEAILLARPHPTLRHYFPGVKEARRWGLPARERAPDLEQQNVRAGLPPRVGAPAHAVGR